MAQRWRTMAHDGAAMAQRWRTMAHDGARGDTLTVGLCVIRVNSNENVENNVEGGIIISVTETEHLIH